MQIGEFQKYKVNPNAPEWLVQSLTKAEEVGFGAFCCVLASSNPSRVVKFSGSSSDLDAHEALAKESVHFPAVYRRFNDALESGQGPLHAIEIERAIPAPWQVLRQLVDFLYLHRVHRIKSLALAAQGFKAGDKFTQGLPESLGIALENLYTYAVRRHGFSAVIDLYREDNWGERSDGTLVILDPLNIPVEFAAKGTGN